MLLFCSFMFFSVLFCSFLFFSVLLFLFFVLFCFCFFDTTKEIGATVCSYVIICLLVEEKIELGPVKILNYENKR